MVDINKFIGKPEKEDKPIEPTEEQLKACVKMEKENETRQKR